MALLEADLQKSSCGDCYLDQSIVAIYTVRRCIIMAGTEEECYSLQVVFSGQQRVEGFQERRRSKSIVQNIIVGPYGVSTPPVSVCAILLLD